MENSPKALQKLSEDQGRAVEFPSGPFLVLAGAGSGKTRVLINRIVHLLNEGWAQQHEILAVTFTNKAAKEMKSRIEKTLGEGKSISQLWIGTFHGICNRLLRAEIGEFEIKDSQGKSLQWTKNFVIFDAGESLTLIKEAATALNLDEKMFPPKLLQSQISNLKNNSLLSAEFTKQAKDSMEAKLAEVYAIYQSKLNLSNALDFDDLLLFTLKLFQNSPEKRLKYFERFKHVLVDEFQDTNQTQYDLLKAIVTTPVVDDSESKNRDWTGRSFCAVGDIDQSIYSWRGANYKLTLNFNRDFPEAELFKLQHNYRSSQEILNVANAVIKNNKQRIDKTLIGTKGSGERITCFEASDELEEANFVASEIKKCKSKGMEWSKLAILYRTNAQSRAIEEALIKNQIPYKIFGGMRFYDRLEIKDLIAYLRLVYNFKDSSALKRVINSPKRGIGASTIATIEQKSDAQGISLYGALSDLLDSGDLGPKAAQAAHSFVNIIDELIKESDKLNVPELLKLLIHKTGYILALQALNTEEADGRIENIYELLNVAEQFEEESEEKTLEAFLTQVALVGDSEKPKGTAADQKEEEQNSVTLMTVHSSKGLEFPFVFLTGLEEGVFPHSRALADTNSAKEELEEERRLLYVAVTRAEEKLYITFARRRRLWGQREYAEPSRFIAEMPKECLVGYWGASISSANTSQRNLASQPSNPRANFSPPPEVEVPKFETGEIVTHKTFGIGKVLGLFGSKAQKFYSVDFQNADGKKLLSGASLQKVNS